MNILLIAVTSLLPVIPQPREFVPAGDGVHVDVSKLAERGRVNGKVDPSAALGDEAYEMTIAADGISSVAKTAKGLRWAKATVDQLAASGSPVPCGTIRDEPLMPFRGFLLDVGRKTYTMAFLRDVVRNLAYYKFNVFHVHLNDCYTDDFNTSGVSHHGRFRLECETDPKLTAKDLFYTKDEFRRFVKESAALGVEIIPEIDSPGHATAFVEAHPEFAKDFARSNYAVDVENPRVLPYIKSILKEYCAGPDPVFAGPLVHIGCDEFGKSDAYPGYVDELLRYVRSLGKTPYVWNDPDQYDTNGVPRVLCDKNVYVGYADTDKVRDRARQAGFTVVSLRDLLTYIVPANPPGYYEDYLDPNRVYENFRIDEGAVGGFYSLWNDRGGNGITEDDSFDRLFPAMQLMAQMYWGGRRGDMSATELRRLMAGLGEAPGVNRAHRLTGEGGKPGPNDTCVGWTQGGGWTATFDLRVPKAEEEVVLFDDGRSWVGVNALGELSFGCESYRHAFDISIAPETWVTLKLVGTPRGVTLYCGKYRVGTTEESVRIKVRESGKVLPYKRMRTLHLPLVRKVGEDVVRNFTVETGVK